MYAFSLSGRAAAVRLIPTMFYGLPATPFATAGLAAAQLRSFLDAGWTQDGEPAASDPVGWAALTGAEQADLTNDYNDWVLRVAAGDPGVIRYGV